MRKECSICAADAQVRAAVDSELQKETPTRAIAKQSGFSKSAIARHSKKCLVRNALSRHKQVVDSEDFYQQQSDGTFMRYSDGKVFATENEIPNDGLPLITVEFVDYPITNAPALDRELPPVGKRNTEHGETFTETVQHSEHAEAGKIAPEPNPQEQSPSHMPPGPQNTCEHQMRRITSSIERCITCGFQKDIAATRQRYSRSLV